MQRPTIVPELSVSDYPKSLEFYHKILGFEILFSRPEYKFACVSYQGGRIMIEQHLGTKKSTDSELEQGQWRTADYEYPLGRGINLEYAVSNIKLIRQRLADNKYPVKLDLREKWYRVDQEEQGVLQFLVMDPDGYLIRFSQDIGRRKIQPI